MAHRHGLLRHSTRALCAALALCGLASAAAQQTTDGAGGNAAGGNLELTTVVEKVVEVKQGDAASKTELVPVDVALPGDEVVYTVSFKNVSPQAADNIKITNPIPRAMRYLANSAFGPGSDVLYSVDGGLTYGSPKELTVKADDGSRRAADASDYTHIRWLLKAPLDAGAKGFARFRAVVR
jgi:uncharacterized repeat protein (TIGR01451 family)